MQASVRSTHIPNEYKQRGQSLLGVIAQIQDFDGNVPRWIYPADQGVEVSSQENPLLPPF